MNMGMEQDGGAGGTDLVGKIGALKEQLASLTLAVDEIAAAAGVEAPVETEDPEVPEVPEGGEGAAPAGPGKMPFGKRKPGGMANALGIGG